VNQSQKSDRSNNVVSRGIVVLNATKNPNIATRQTRIASELAPMNERCENAC